MGGIRSSSSVRISAPAEDVWRAITTPELIREWFFDVETETDWEVGAPIVHRGTWQGRPYEDRGEILAIEPPRRLVHTHWSPMSGLPDRPESYERISWTLEERDGSTELTIAERNLPSEQARATSEQAWALALGNLKELVERGPTSAGR